MTGCQKLLHWVAVDRGPAEKTGLNVEQHPQYLANILHAFNTDSYIISVREVLWWW